MRQNPIKIEEGKYNSCSHLGSRKAGFVEPIQNKINVKNIARSHNLILAFMDSFIIQIMSYNLTFVNIK